MNRPADRLPPRSSEAGAAGRVAFILCGGLGTRLRAMTSRPKAVLEVAGWPFLRYQLEALEGVGIDRIVFLTGHGAEEIERTFGPPAPDRFFVREDEPLGTAGALAHARHLAGSTNWVSNADSFADLPPAQILAARPPELARILAVDVDDRADYGGLRIDEQGRITAFDEKGAGGPGPVSGGVYVLPRPFLEELPAGPASLEKDLFPRWAREGRLHAHRARVFFRDIGTPERLAAAQQEFVPIRMRLEADRKGR